MLNKLAKRIQSGKLKLDGIIIETTGMAHPRSNPNPNPNPFPYP